MAFLDRYIKPTVSFVMTLVSVIARQGRIHPALRDADEVSLDHHATLVMTRDVRGLVMTREEKVSR